MSYDNCALQVLAIEDAHRELMQKLELESITGDCLYWAYVACNVLRLQGHPCQVEAGDMSWRFCPPESDDGISPTHYSYIFDLSHPLSQLQLASGSMPEIHVWSRLTETDEIIDFSTRNLIQQMAKMIPHAKWQTLPPPQYLWTDNLPEGVLYNPKDNATRLAYHAMACLGLELAPNPKPKLQVTPASLGAYYHAR